LGRLRDSKGRTYKTVWSEVAGLRELGNAFTVPPIPSLPTTDYREDTGEKNEGDDRLY